MEYELLVHLARTVLYNADRQRVREIVEKPLNWEGLTALAGYHGVAPLAYYHLKGAFESHVPPEVLRHLQLYVNAQTANSLYLTSELSSLGTLLREEGIPAISVKGISLAESVYGGLALRPFVDIDLLIRRSDFPRLEELLRAHRFRQHEMDRWRRALYLLVHGQCQFWRPAGRGGMVAVLDVHTALLPPGYSYGGEFGALWERSAPMAGSGGGIRALRPEDLLIVLCYHGFKNRWDRLKHIADVAELVRACPELGWDEVFERAGSMRGRRVLLLGLYLAEQVLGAALPEPVRVELRSAPMHLVGDPIVARLPEQAHIQVEPYWDRVELNLRAQDGLRGRLRYGLYAAGRRLSELLLPDGA